MREFSVPPVVTVGDAANLTDPVWDNAERRAGRGAVRRAAPATAGQRRHLRASSATRWSRSPAGLIAAGIEPGDRVGADEPDPVRVDAARLRDLGGRRGHRADLRDVQRRAGRAGSSPTPARSPASSRPPRTRATVAGVRDQLPELRARLADRRPAAVDELVAAGAAVDPRRGRAAPRAVRRRRPGHDHLHQRHHRPAQGLRADPPQHALRHRQRDPGAAEPVPRGRLDAAVPAAGARLRPADPDRRGAGPGHDSATPPTSRTWSPTCGASSRRSCCRVPRVFEKVYNTARQKAARRRQGRDLRPGRAGRDRLQRGAGHAGGPGPGAAAPARALRPAGLRASCAPRSAAGATARSPAARRSARGSATSSAASA